jgi:fatty acid synthase subunit alpha, fungi type
MAFVLVSWYVHDSSWRSTYSHIKQSSFGFGQVGGVCLVLHPRYLLGALEPSVYEAYKVKNRRRYQLTYKAMSEMMTNNSLVKVKDTPPYSKDLEGPVLLNSLARASYDAKTGSYAYSAKLASAAVLDTSNASAVSQIFAQDSTMGVGVDQELISSVPSWNPTFIARNFTDAEVAYCQSQPSPPASFAARWAGKEAVFKALGVQSKGAAAPMKEIEILPDSAGVPSVTLHGDAKTSADSKGITKVLISLSHSEVRSMLNP